MQTFICDAKHSIVEKVSLMLELLTFLSAIITIAIILESTPESVQ